MNEYLCWMKIYGVEVEWILFVEHKNRSLNENIMSLSLSCHWRDSLSYLILSCRNKMINLNVPHVFYACTSLTYKSYRNDSTKQDFHLSIALNTYKVRSLELVISSAWFTLLNSAFSFILLTFGNAGSPVLFPPHYHLPIPFSLSASPSMSRLILRIPALQVTLSFRLTMYGSLACGLRLIVVFFLPRSPLLRYPLLSSVITDFWVRFHNLKSIISCGRPTFMKSLKKYPLVPVL